MQQSIEKKLLICYTVFTIYRGDIMAGKSSCEFCAYYNYNEYYDDYECSVNLDEDDLARFMSGSDTSCPYFRFSDDYKIVEKQN